MINPGITILFNEDVEELDACIRKALNRVADAMLEAYGLVDIDLDEGVTTKTNPIGGFAKFVRLGILRTKRSLGQEYISNAFEIYMSGKEGRDSITETQFDQFVGGKRTSNLEYKKSYMPSLRTGCGLFLVNLHCNRAITLPSSFNWPVNRTRGAATALAASIVCSDSELVSFVRSINTASEAELDSAFAAIGRHQKKIEWFSTYGTKMLLSTGWHAPEEVNTADLQVLRRAEDGRGGSIAPVINATQATLIDTIQRKFGDRCRIKGGQFNEWQRRVSAKQEVGWTSLEGLVDLDEAVLLKEVAGLMPSSATPERMKELRRVAGLDFDLREKSAYWVELQELYLRKRRRENYKQVITALGLLNLYLFFYLPNWYSQHPEWDRPFPDTPNNLIGSIFVSRMRKMRTVTPATFVEFMEIRAREREHVNETTYGYLKQVEKFFEFVTNNADSLEDCDTFKQPLSEFDYPPSSRPFGTTKMSFPRRLYGLFIAYVEAVKLYIDSAVEKAANLEIREEDLYALVAISSYSIDTQRLDVQRIMGDSPFVEIEGEKFPIRYLPYFPSASWFTLKSGRSVKLPRPHAINQILVALYTGLRHNHIQWLDADKYDALVQDGDNGFTRLLVNTDKAKKKAWPADVNYRVIEILNDQRAWRDLIAEDAFSQLVFYNNNEQTAYPRFRPLFSYDAKKGHPHPDAAYTRAWSDLLIGFQAWANEHLIKEDDQPVRICRLAAPKIDLVDLEEKDKLDRYRTWNQPYCPLRVATETTPHSSRVTVVTTLTYFLSPDLIGKRITGQQVGTVAYYVRPSPEDMEKAAVHQAMELQQRAMRNHVDTILKGDGRSDETMIKAASINSALARSMHTDIGQTIIRFGCMSIAVGNEYLSGLDVLAEVGASRVAYNTTEICPYNNVCPPRVLEITKGARRCSLCPAAVRSIDHLPAIVAAKKQGLELLSDLDAKIEAWETSARFTDPELDELEERRQQLGEDLAGWQLCEAILETTRARLAEGTDTRTWVVEQPEIIERDLRRAEVQSSDTLHLLGRLAECIAFPGFTSPKVERIFDKFRRQILISSGDIIGAIGEAPIDPAAECTGLLRSLVAAKRLSVDEVVAMLTTDRHLELLPPSATGMNVMELAND